MKNQDKLSVVLKTAVGTAKFYEDTLIEMLRFLDEASAHAETIKALVEVMVCAETDHPEAYRILSAEMALSSALRKMREKVLKAS